MLCDQRDDARRAPTGDIILSYCHGCGFVHNRVFDSAKLSYGTGYEASLVHSTVFLEFLQGVADRLIARFDLHGKTVMEIGCGTGHFLRMLCAGGGNAGIGIDPSASSEGTEQVGHEQIRWIPELFSDRHVDLAADFVCCLSALEHIPDPAAMLRAVRQTLPENGGAYFEVFNAFNAFRQRETWSVHYEQCNYFGLRSLETLFRSCGFRVLEVAECYENSQYVRIDAEGGGSEPPAGRSVSDRGQTLASGAENTAELPTELAGFAKAHADRLATWRERLERFKTRGDRVVTWGTGGKGINFLNALDTADLIPYALEINPHRQGKYVPGSAQKIMPIEFLADYRPDVIIITNSLYEREMKQQASELGVNAEFLIA